MKNPEKILDYLIETDIYTYRLCNGDIIIAEEVLYENDDRTFISFPGLLIPLYDQDTDQDFALAPWDIFPTKELIELNSNNVISKVETTMSLKAHYFNFIIVNNETSNVDDELDEALDILKQFTIDEASFDHNKRWQWKPELN